VVAASEDVDLSAHFRKMVSDPVHVNVLSAAVDAANDRQRGCVLADERNAFQHPRAPASAIRCVRPVTERNASSHSEVKRAMSNFLIAAARAPALSCLAWAGSSRSRRIFSTRNSTSVWTYPETPFSMVTGISVVASPTTGRPIFIASHTARPRL